MPDLNTTSTKQESVVIVGIITHNQNENQLKEYLDELAFLVDTAGGKVIKRFVQRLAVPDSRTFVGSGKLQEIHSYIIENDVDLVVFDDELSGAQIRNIEEILECKVLDRNNLILDIFVHRAQSSYAKTQVELAQLQYTLPRLTRMWTHLSKQKGGIGQRGPGEKEIETDRRIIKQRITLLKEKLEIIDKQKITQRKNRESLIRVALIGYTNVGKSTIMNLISKSDVFAENKLFATLDTTVRKVVIGNLPFLLSDTVGFIRKLPHSLVESFRSTLDEVREADILVHIVDMSHPNFEEQIEVVNQTLNEIKAADKPVIIVFNKIDDYQFVPKDEDDLTPTIRENVSLEELQRTWIGRSNDPCLFISAINKTNIQEFKDVLSENVKTLFAKRYPYKTFLF